MFDRSAILAAPPVPEGPNLLVLLVGIFVRPARTLRAIAAGPPWLWAVPLVFALALAVAAGVAMLPAREAAQIAASTAFMEEQVEQLPAEMRASPPEEMTQVAPPSRILMLWVPLGFAVAGIALGWLVRAAILHVSSLALGGQQSFAQVYRTSAWASFPLLVRTGVQTLYAVAGGGLVTKPGLAGLLPDAGVPASLSATLFPSASLPEIILGRIDLYTLWYLVLLGIAISAAGKLPRGKTFIVTAIYAVLSLVIGLGQLLTRGITGG